jgi:DNA-binding cell septation regulator SpoVG
MNIVVRRWQKHESGALRGFADFEILDISLLIKDCRVFQGQSGRTWINLPERTYQVDGETKYEKFLVFSDKNIAEDFRTSALDAMRRHLESEKQKSYAPPPESPDDDIPF